jgi:NAD(P)-dependent dehydrogenase (short-subunit alcohol dehydrogenase family)
VSRTAIVTGSASGIGAAVAAALENDGYTVAGLDIDPAAPYVVDVSDATAVAETVARVVAELGPVDAVVSAAGHYEMVPISDITSQQLHRMLRVHLGGLRNITRSVLPSMIERGTGSIIAITSELAIGGADGGGAHYAAAKGAIIGLVRSLAVEVAGRGVRVNAVAPGPADTPLLTTDSPWRAPEYLATIPNRRLTRPDEIAQVVSFLLDDDAGFCVGEILSPNGGTVV